MGIAKSVIELQHTQFLAKFARVCPRVDRVSNPGFCNSWVDRAGFRNCDRVTTLTGTVQKCSIKMQNTLLSKSSVCNLLNTAIVKVVT